jgi:F420-dependent oxidoreductase-like protein
MRIGINDGTLNDGTIEQVIENARTAEEQGFDSYWVSQIFGHDAMTVLSLVGREVPRIELGVAVVPTFPRHPMQMAQQALTTNAATDGRFTLGIGLSHQPVVEGMWGYPFEKPIRHMREYLSALMPLLEEQSVRFQGDTATARGDITVQGGSRPAVMLAALGEQMLKLTAQYADGTLTWCTGPKTLAEHTVPTLRAAAEEAGRDATRVAAALPVCVTTDVAGAQDRAASVFEVYGQLPSYRKMLDREGAASPADIVIAGSADECAERIMALGQIGVTDFSAAEFATDPDERAATREMLQSLITN